MVPFLFGKLKGRACLLSHCSLVQLSVTLWTVAQAPLSMGFSRQESWSGLQGPPHRAAYVCLKGLPDSSAGKESACNTGDPASIPGSERSSGEGIGCPVQYSWASLVAQLVKKPPVMRETWVQSLGDEETLEEGMATHSSILAWRIPRTEEPGGLWSIESQTSWTQQLNNSNKQQ